MAKKFTKIKGGDIEGQIKFNAPVLVNPKAPEESHMVKLFKEKHQGTSEDFVYLITEEEAFKKGDD